MYEVFLTCVDSIYKIDASEKKYISACNAHVLTYCIGGIKFPLTATNAMVQYVQFKTSRVSVNVSRRALPHKEKTEK